MTNDGITPSRLPARRRFIAGAVAGALALTAAPEAASAQQARRAAPGSNAVALTQRWDKTFPKSPRVAHRKVTFTNRYGITLAADLYTPRDRGTETLPAVAVSGPFGAVKEQSSGLYAQAMAERGYVAPLHDQPHAASRP